MKNKKPKMNGITLPNIATKAEALPTKIKDLTSDSKPTSKSNKIAPNSANIFRNSWVGVTKPKTLGPRIIPAISSPKTSGWSAYLLKAPQSLAVISTIANCKSGDKTSAIPPQLPCLELVKEKFLNSFLSKN